MLYFLLFVVAFLYSAVGHGGASGYLALMALFNIPPTVMKPTALMLNLFVSFVAFLQFYKGGHFIKKIFIPLAIASIPMSFLGGTITVETLLYKKILGVFLFFPVLRFIFFPNTKESDLKPSNIVVSLGIGATIGFLSGLIGIGGGIILSPILLFLKWTNQKQAAAIGALFIFVNSLAGLAGQFTKGIHFTSDMKWYVIITATAGLAGAYLGAKKFNQKVLKYILAAVLLVAAIKLLLV